MEEQNEGCLEEAMIKRNDFFFPDPKNPPPFLVTGIYIVTQPSDHECWLRAKLHSLEAGELQDRF